MPSDWQNSIRLIRTATRDEIVEARLFPAADQRAVDRIRAVVAARTSAAEEATCFFHDSNRAETTCASCGRFVCALCAIPVGAVKICPTCLMEGRRSGQAVDLKQTGPVWDNRLLLLAALPLIPPVWFLLPITGLLTLILVAWRWSKPASLLRSGKPRYVLAALIALGGIPLGVWLVLNVLDS